MFEVQKTAFLALGMFCVAGIYVIGDAQLSDISVFGCGV